MPKFNFGSAKLTVEFEFSKVNNKTMIVKIAHNSTHSYLHPVESGTYSINIDIILPGIVKFDFLGKDNNIDTIVVDNKIVDDLCVKIKNIFLDGFAVDDAVLHQLPKLTTETGLHITSNYIGFNGTFDLVMSEKNIFNQLMAWKRQY